jgi:transposase
LFSYVDIEDRIPAFHPLRKVRTIVNKALAALDAEFAKLYAADGRPSIAPERLLRAALLQILFSIRSERQLMEQMQYNLLFRWFVGLGVDDPVWVPTVFTKNRDRLLTTDIARKFLAAILSDKAVAPLLSDEHFSVDGTLIEAWASMKSFKPKAETDGAEPPAGEAGSGGGATSAGEGRNAEVNFHGEKRSNETHASVTDPDARLYRKGEGKEAKLCYMGHALMENRNGLVVEACLTGADGHAERHAALAMIEQRADRPIRITLGADKGYDTEDFVNELKSMNVTPHVAAKAKGSAIDGRTTRHAGYAISQRIRKRIEEAFGWSKTIGPAAKTMLRGVERVGAQFTFTLAAYNLVRLPQLLAA